MSAFSIWVVLIAFFRSLGSMHSRSLPGFISATILLFQGFGPSIFAIILCLVRSANLCFKGSFIAANTSCRLCCTGVIELSASM